MNTPILLITFNRPDHVRRVLTEILKQNPSSLYICQDGARENNDIDHIKCQEVRDVINELTSAYRINNKDFHLHTLYQTKNLGCGPGPAAGITWFFDHVEMGIVMEDDCLPHADFFVYCEELLERYKDNERISFIGGCNYSFAISTNASYSFMGGHHQTWGWASWKRTWKQFEYYLKEWDDDQFEKVVKNYYKDNRQRTYWKKIFSMVKKDRLKDSCWDYQLYFSCWKMCQLAICPSVNLVSNVGFGKDATHTNSENNDMLNLKTSTILPLVHPKNIVYDRSLDDYMMKKYIIPYEYGWSGFKRIPYHINAYIKKLLNHQGPWLKKN